MLLGRYNFKCTLFTLVFWGFLPMTVTGLSTTVPTSHRGQKRLYYTSGLPKCDFNFNALEQLKHVAQKLVLYSSAATSDLFWNFSRQTCSEFPTYGFLLMYFIAFAIYIPTSKSHSKADMFLKLWANIFPPLLPWSENVNFAFLWDTFQQLIFKEGSKEILFLNGPPIPASFSFIFVFSKWHNYKFIKAWGLNLGRQNGRYRQIHWAMEAPPSKPNLIKSVLLNGWFFSKSGYPLPLFLYFRLFYKQLTVNMFNKSCQWLDLNLGPLSTVAQPLPQWLFILIINLKGTILVEVFAALKL